MGEEGAVGFAEFRGEPGFFEADAAEQECEPGKRENYGGEIAENQEHGNAREGQASVAGMANIAEWAIGEDSAGTVVRFEIFHEEGVNPDQPDACERQEKEAEGLQGNADNANRKQVVSVVEENGQFQEAEKRCDSIPQLIEVLRVEDCSNLFRSGKMAIDKKLEGRQRGAEQEVAAGKTIDMRMEAKERKTDEEDQEEDGTQSGHRKSIAPA